MTVESIVTAPAIPGYGFLKHLRFFTTIIKEEIIEEGIVRSLQPFLRFIGIAGHGSTSCGRSTAQEKVVVDRMIGVYNGTRSYHYDGLDVFPCGEFLTRLHNSEFF